MDTNAEHVWKRTNRSNTQLGIVSILSTKLKKGPMSILPAHGLNFYVIHETISWAQPWTLLIALISYSLPGRFPWSTDQDFILNLTVPFSHRHDNIIVRKMLTGSSSCSYRTSKYKNVSKVKLFNSYCKLQLKIKL